MMSTSDVRRRRAVRGWAAIALAGTLAVAGTGMARAAPGNRDTAFGGDGRVTTNLTDSVDSVADLAIQPDGRIVAAGVSSSRFALTRYTSHGALDPTFGGDGIVVTDFTPRRYDGATAVAIQPNGRILAVGLADARHDWRHERFALVRYRANGKLDRAFGHDGKVATSFTDGYDGATDLVLQPDRRIVVVGSTPAGWAVARYERDGSLDPSFGDAGRVSTSLTGACDLALGVAIQGDGKIVVAGTAGCDAFAVARYDADGTLDPTFGTDGVVSLDLTSGYDAVNALAIQGDGKIVAAGKAGNCCEYTGALALARFTTHGALDTSFGVGGVRTTDPTGWDEQAADVALEPDGDIVVAGHGGYGGFGSDGYVVVARYDPDGSLDPTLGHDGMVRTGFGKGADAATAVAIQGNGKILAAGTADGDEDPRFALVRYLG